MITAPTPAPPVDYGSGMLGDWSGLRQVISSPSTIRQVRSAGGVFMAGDSITAATYVELGQMVGPLAVNAWSGRPTAPAVDAIAGWISTYGAPQRILMATGNNDIFDPTVMGAQVDRLMTAAGPGRTVFWVSVQVSRWLYSAAVQLADQRNSGWVNAQLYEATSRWPNLRVIPWHWWLAVKPSRLAAYLTDGVHVNPAGGTFRNTIIRDAIGAT
jgi:hypothetical protein